MANPENLGEKSWLKRYWYVVAGGMLLLAFIIWIFGLYDAFLGIGGLYKRWDIGAKVGGGILVMIGLVLTAQRIAASNTQAQAAMNQAAAAATQAKTATLQVQAIEDGQITERFGRAIEQLGAYKTNGEANLEIRLGGIYALERIARKSEEDHWAVMEVLCAYVRENARVENARVKPAENAGDGTMAELQPRVDIQAALTAIGRRADRIDQGVIDLRRTDLQGADLVDAKLANVDLRFASLVAAQLQNAVLTKAQASNADMRANFEEADLRRMKAYHADFTGAELSGVDLRLSKLRSCIMSGARTSYTRLEGADLQLSTFTPEQLYFAILDKGTLHYFHEHRERLLESSKRNLDRLERFREKLEHQRAQPTTTDQYEVIPESKQPAAGMAALTEPITTTCTVVEGSSYRSFRVTIGPMDKAGREG